MPRNELYLGNLSKDVTQRDIEGVFKRHGKILRCDIKNKGAYQTKFIFFMSHDMKMNSITLSQ
jgi:hypothetical protein